jgi:large subunit ribosomal protein L13
MMKTYMANSNTVERKWYVVDAKGKTLGRLSSEIAKILRGKHKPTYTPHVDTGDFVIVINAELVEVTGKKAEQKLYRRHSRYPGGLKETTFNEMIDKKPTEVIYTAVKGMLPHNSLGRNMLKKLKVYAGPVHKHEAQQPELLEL